VVYAETESDDQVEQRAENDHDVETVRPQPVLAEDIEPLWSINPRLFQ
jgi:hypothetical protein